MKKSICRCILSIILCTMILFAMNKSAQANVLREIRAMAQQWSGLRKLINIGSLKYTGKGIKIGVIDSGIDSTHAKLRGKVLEGKGYNYVLGELYGHGTNIAGIISEIAPAARLADYRVIDSEGEADNGNVLYALGQAIKDDVHVINMSLSANMLNEEQLTQLKNVVEQAYRRGIVIVSAAGNEGEWGCSNVSVPAVFPRVVAVGASTPSLCLPFAQLVGTNRKITLNPTSSGFDQLIGTTSAIADLRTGTPENFKQHLQGKVVLYHEGSSWYHDVLKKAKQEGARAVLLVNKKGPLLYGPRSDSDSLALGAEISIRDGSFLQQCLSQAIPQYIQFGKGMMPKSVMTKMSSWGNPSGTDKPDLVAPGYKIVSTHPSDSYYEGTGTSYAAPMVAGAVALLKEAHPDWSAGEIVSSLCLNAGPLEDDFSGKSYQPIIQGSGQLNVAQALMSETLIFPNRIHFYMNRSNLIVEKQVTIRNKSSKSKTYFLRTEENDLTGMALSSPHCVTVPSGEKCSIPLNAALSYSEEAPQNCSGRLYVTCEEQEMNIPVIIESQRE